MILEKYRHLTTPPVILQSLEEAKPKRKSKEELKDFNKYTEIIGNHDRFLTDSICFRNEKGHKSNVIPFNTYFPTFDTMDSYRKQFYFYWRNEASKGHFLDTELSYIFLFAYELLNYGYNSDAAFNISMLERLYNEYVRRYPRLEKYLPVWMADFLFELGELELASEWVNTTDTIESEYETLKSMENNLQNISITTWWKFIPERTRSPFFAKHKTKIYASFKECVTFLHAHYLTKDKEIGIFEHLFTEQEIFVKRDLFTSAVLARETVTQGISVTKRSVNQDYCHFLSQLMRLAENFQRIQLNHEAFLPIKEGILSDSLQSNLLDHLEASGRKSRFVKVSKGSNPVSLYPIPSNPNKEVEILLELDNERIKELSEDSEELKRIFEEKYSDDEDAEIEPSVPPTTAAPSTVESLFQTTHLESEMISAFIASLSNLEKEVLSLINKGQPSIAPISASLKPYGVMIGTFLIELNEKAEEYLEEVILEEVDDTFEVTEEFQFILNLLEA